MSIRKILTIFLAFASLILPMRAAIILKPYLQAMTENNVYVLVESDSESEVRVLYGEDENTNMFHNTNFILKTSSKTPSYVHRIELDNLKPGTKYYYRVMQEGVDTPLETFTTPRNDGHLRVVVSGDCRSKPEIWARIVDSMAARKPDILLFTGDLAGSPKYSSWKKEFFVYDFLKLAKSTAFFNAPGNHEGWKTNTKAFTQAPSSPSKRQDYYSFELGNTLFVILNTQTSIKKGSPQYKFLEDVLKKSDKTWKIVVFHKSAYVGGGHGEYGPMKAVSKALFVKYGVDLAISGHSHFYQRNYVDGVYHLTIAGGGAPLYTPKKKKYTQKQSRKHHYAFFEIDGNVLRFKVYDLKGNIIDSFDIKK